MSTPANGNGKQTIIAIAAIAVSLLMSAVNAAWTFTSGNGKAIEAVEERSQKRNEQANDRIAAAVSDLSARIAAIDVRSNGIDNKLNEVETQFSQTKQQTYLRVHELWGYTSLIFEKDTGQKMPTMPEFMYGRESR